MGPRWKRFEAERICVFHEDVVTPEVSQALNDLRARVLDRLLPKVGSEDLYVSILAVPQHHRRKGIASALMERILAGAERMGLGVALDTAMGEPARELYEKLGFRVITARETNASERKFIPVEGMLRMERPLPAP